MRHGKKFNHLGRTHSHRSALLSNMATSLLVHKRIRTTVAKAKALRVYIEPLITRSKNDSTHNRRVVFSYLQNKEGVKALFDEISDKVANRPGGYTRIIRLGNRPGDNAEMAMIELVDFNTVYTNGDTKKAATTGKKRTRRAGSAKKETSSTTPAANEVAPEASKEKAAE
jgi:large subunit ribosomal protein L17